MEEETTGQSRLFVILAIALIGLLVLGLLGIGGVFVIRQNLQEQAAVSGATPTLVIRLPNPSPTSTPLTAPATSTPQPTPTNTPVMAAGSGGQEASVGEAESEQGNQEIPSIIKNNPTPTRTPVPGAAAAGLPDQVPETGLGALEAVLIAIALVTVLFVARRMRLSL